MTIPPSQTPKIKVKTNLPILPLRFADNEEAIQTEHLILRPLRASDLSSLHDLRSRPESGMSGAHPSSNPRNRNKTEQELLQDTRRVLESYFYPREKGTFYLGICLRRNQAPERGEDKPAWGLGTNTAGEGGRQGDEEGELIGIGGCHHLPPNTMFGWPVVGYVIQKEHWGKGYTTEFLQAWLGAWRALEREVREVLVDPRTVSFPQIGSPGCHDDKVKEGEDREQILPQVPEQIVTYAVSDNVGSWRVMEKAGFEHLLTWEEPDLRNPSVDVELKAYRIFV